VCHLPDAPLCEILQDVGSLVRRVVHALDQSSYSCHLILLPPTQDTAPTGAADKEGPAPEGGAGPCVVDHRTMCTPPGGSSSSGPPT